MIKRQHPAIPICFGLKKKQQVIETLKVSVQTSVDELMECTKDFLDFFFFRFTPLKADEYPTEN